MLMLSEECIFSTDESFVPLLGQYAFKSEALEIVQTATTVGAVYLYSFPSGML